MAMDMDLLRYETCRDCKVFGGIWTVSKNQERTCRKCGLVATAVPVDDSYDGNKHYTDDGSALDMHVERVLEKGLWFTRECCWRQQGLARPLTRRPACACLPAAVEKQLVFAGYDCSGTVRRAEEWLRARALACRETGVSTLPHCDLLKKAVALFAVTNDSAGAADGSGLSMAQIAQGLNAFAAVDKKCESDFVDPSAQARSDKRVLCRQASAHHRGHQGGLHEGRRAHAPRPHGDDGPRDPPDRRDADGRRPRLHQRQGRGRGPTPQGQAADRKGRPVGNTPAHSARLIRLCLLLLL